MRFLFVDDDPDMRALALRAVRREFPDLEPVEVIDEVTLNAALGSPVDVLVADFDLHWSDGLKVFEQVKSTSPGCCSVMFTGTGNEELAVRAMKAGFDDYVVKGIDQFKRLVSGIQIALERRRRHDELEGNRDLLLKELYHRLHNNLQIVIGLIRMTERALSTQADRQELADLGSRIQALSSLQEEFYRGQDFRNADFGHYLCEISHRLVKLSGRQIELACQADDIHLGVDIAIPLGLIANELITNSVKHAFPGDRTGRISIRAIAEGAQIVLVIADNGVGAGSAVSDKSLGKTLVRRLAEQIRADLHEDGDGGTRWTVKVKI